VTGTTPDTHAVPQRAVLVLPSTGEFDSRTYRIASTLVDRGHSVVVLARGAPGLPADEMHPAGYRIVRLELRAIQGLPFRDLIARLRRLTTSRGRTRDGQPGQTPTPAAARVTSPRADAAPPLAAARSLPRRLVKSGVRRFAIPLTIRAYTRLALSVAPEADLYHGMAYMGLPVALALGRRHRAAVVYDARDIYLEARSMARSRGIVRWTLAAAERRWARRAGRVVTVNEDYADVLAARLGVRRPLVVMNCSYRYDPPEPRVRRFHDALGLASDTKIVLYHGGLFPERGIEQLIDAIVEVPDATLVLMGYGVLEEELRRRARDPSLAGRLRFVPPVRPEQLHDWVAAADVVAMPIQPSTLNHRLATPNKLFEAMAAGVPVVASDLPGMARVVSTTGCGVLCDGTDPRSVAVALRDVLDNPARGVDFGRRGHAWAADTYNWEHQAELLLGEYGKLTGRRW
jgi:glycosyltransferase involved in cell wall biosynthesis